MSTTVKAFYCPISEIRGNDVRSGILIYPIEGQHRLAITRGNDVRSGILIYPLPDADQVLRNRIYLALKKLDIQISDFTITDSTSIETWCKSVGIQPIDTPSLLGIWTYKTHPETCIKLVQKIVREYLDEKQ